jgi:hypothetical protein
MSFPAGYILHTGTQSNQSCMYIFVYSLPGHPSILWLSCHSPREPYMLQVSPETTVALREHADVMCMHYISSPEMVRGVRNNRVEAAHLRRKGMIQHDGMICVHVSTKSPDTQDHRVSSIHGNLQLTRSHKHVRSSYSGESRRWPTGRGSQQQRCLYSRGWRVTPEGQEFTLGWNDLFLTGACIQRHQVVVTIEMIHSGRNRKWPTQGSFLVVRSFRMLL